jgi:hypothetical protein
MRDKVKEVASRGWADRLLDTRAFDLFIDAFFGALAGWATYLALGELIAPLIVAMMFFLLCLAYQTGLPAGIAPWIFLGWAGGLVGAHEIGDWSFGIGGVVAFWLICFIVDHWPPPRWGRGTEKNPVDRQGSRKT